MVKSAVRTTAACSSSQSENRVSPSEKAKLSSSWRVSSVRSTMISVTQTQAAMRTTLRTMSFTMNRVSSAIASHAKASVPMIARRCEREGHVTPCISQTTGQTSSTNMISTMRRCSWSPKRRRHFGQPSRARSQSW